MEKPTEIPLSTILRITVAPAMSINNSAERGANTITADHRAAAEFNIHVSTLVICTIANVFIVLLSCYGNGKILVTCCRTFKVHSNFRWLKTNMSAADFLLSLTQCPLLAILLFGMPMPVLAQVLVPIAMFCAGLGLTVSLNSISGIAIHRYLKLKCNYEIARKFTSIFIVYSWISGIIVASCFACLIVTTPGTHATKLSEIVLEDAQFHTTAYVLITFFLVTIAVVSFVYIAIAKLLLSVSNAECSTSQLTKCTNLPLKTKNNNLYSNSIASNHKAVLACIGISCAHSICWLPFVFTFIFQHYAKNDNILCNIKVIVWMLVLLQSAVNPYIYQIPKKKYFRRWHCQHCILHWKCELHSKWILQGADQKTKTLEVSENGPSPKTASGIYLIQIPENGNVL